MIIPEREKEIKKMKTLKETLNILNKIDDNTCRIREYHNILISTRVTWNELDNLIKNITEVT